MSSFNFLQDCDYLGKGDEYKSLTFWAAFRRKHMVRLICHGGLFARNKPNAYFYKIHIVENGTLQMLHLR